MNVTFDSECEMYRQKCLCRRNQAGCIDREYRRGHLDYFGECKGENDLPASLTK